MLHVDSDVSLCYRMVQMCPYVTGWFRVSLCYRMVQSVLVLQVGSDVYLCYKKAMVKTDVLAYKPSE